MAISVSITNIVGQQPFDVYVCQEDGTGCFYIATITNTSYEFDIPEPYDNSTEYLFKIVDNNGCVIEKTASL